MCYRLIYRYFISTLITNTVYCKLCTCIIINVTFRSKVPNVLIAITVFHVNLCYISTAKMNVTQWLERDGLPMSLPAVRFRTRLGVGFSEKCYVSPFLMFGHGFDVVCVGKARYIVTLTCFT